METASETMFHFNFATGNPDHLIMSFSHCAVSVYAFSEVQGKLSLFVAKTCIVILSGVHKTSQNKHVHSQ